MRVYIKKLDDRAITPTRGSACAAGYDLYACIGEEGVRILPNKSVKIGTGFAIAPEEENVFFGVFARSGLAAKQSLRPANCVGVIDSDYRGEVSVVVHNDGTEARVIHHGDRIGQLLLLPFIPMEFVETDMLQETERGTNGFGSTGV